MYTYLNQKYGLKPLIVEWAAAIINAVKTYIKEEHDVALFAKILKNECEETFRLTQDQVKDTLTNLIKVILKDKYPLKSEKEILKMLETVQKGKIEDWMWRKILEHEYEAQDALMIEERIRDYQAQKQRQSVDSSPSLFQSRKMSRQELNQQAIDGSKQNSKLLYSDFKKIILDSTLNDHESVLGRFTDLFKSVDRDQDGVISEKQFRELLQMMSVYAEDESKIDQLLAYIDPFNNKKMTYSEVVVAVQKYQLIEKFNQLAGAEFDVDDALRMEQDEGGMDNEYADQESKVDEAGY